MSCPKCDEEKQRLKLKEYEALKKKAIEYARSNSLEKIYMVQTKNFPAYKREDDPDRQRFTEIEILYID